MADQPQTQPQSTPPAPKPSGRSQRKLKNYFIDLRYQLKFTLTMVGIAAVLTGGLGYFVHQKSREASEIVKVQAMDPTLEGPALEMANELKAQFASGDRVVTYALIGFGVLMSLVLTLYGIVLTHKVAGPLFKVTIHLDKIRDGKLGKLYPLRQGDELVEFFDHFKAAHDALRKQEEDDIALFERAAASVTDPKLKEEIAVVIAQKVESLK